MLMILVKLPTDFTKSCSSFDNIFLSFIGISVPGAQSDGQCLGTDRWLSCELAPLLIHKRETNFSCSSDTIDCYQLLSIK